jgi:dipeptidyl aminopeptidase/acylaminoacyl peptidase
VGDRLSLSQPVFSPGGDRIYFLSDGSAGRQVFALPTKGGESFQVTQASRDVHSFALSPNGRTLALIEEEGEDKSSEPYRDAFEVGNTGYLTNGPGRVAFLATVGVDGTNYRRITDASVSLATGLTVSALSWSPDGKGIAFTGFPSPNSGDSDLGRINLVDLGDGTLTRLTQGSGNESDPAFSPDGKWIYFLAPRDYVPAQETELYRIGVGSGIAENLSGPLDREIAGFVLRGNGDVWLWGADGAKTSVWVYASGKFRPLAVDPLGAIAEVAVSTAGAMLVTGEEVYRPTELYYRPSGELKLIRLTDHHRELATLAQGRREEFTWSGAEGFRPNGIITYPPGFTPEGKHPLVLLIHGGPTSASLLGFSAMPQLMAARGWIVFQPNYRGSNNLGNAFQRAIENDAAEGPGKDVMSGVEELLKRPYIDAGRVGISGWSYGGWMTAWMIGRYPDVWAAAMAGAAPVDYTDMYSLSDLNRMRRHAITQSPYAADNLMKSWQQSPIIHFSKLRTPTLVMSKTRDERVSITGSYKLYHALRDNGVKAKFIAYPGGGHTVTDPVRSVDLHEKWLNWLAEFFK